MERDADTYHVVERTPAYLTGGAGVVVDADRQSQLNAEVWSQGAFVDIYASRALRKAETVVIERNRSALAGRVLELGCGAGRLTGHLIGIAREVHGVDISPAMIDYCRRTYPRATFSVADLRDLSAFPDGSYEAVVAIANVLDVLGDAERRRVLGEIARILVPGGLLIASSHNLDFASHIAKPTHIAKPERVDGRTLREIIHAMRQIPRRVRNRRRLLPLQRVENDYAILIDEAHDFSLLHYYISRDAQARQLAEQGLELLECVDVAGASVGPGEMSGDSSELHYAARRSS
jgi:SAM-dependent methyltransferase